MIAIRSYDPGDWEGVCLVHDLARPLELRGSCDPAAFVPLALDPTGQDIHGCAKWVAVDAERGDRVVGFVAVDGAHIGWVYVDPQYLRRGIGRKLLRLALRKAGGSAWTTCLDGNAPALAFCRSEGLVEAGRYAVDIMGYPCVCVRLQLRGPTGSASDS